MRRRKDAPRVDKASVQALDSGSENISEREKAIVEQAKKAIKTVHLPADTARQKQLVYDAWVNGYSERETKRILANQKPPIHISLGRIKTLKARVQEESKAEFERDRPTLKHQQLARLARYRRLAEGRRTLDGRTWIEEPNHAALAKYEQLYADIAGTKEPLKIDVEIVHREAIIEVVGDMTDETADQLVAAYDNLAQLAHVGAKQLGMQMPELLPKPVITVEPLKTETNGVKKAS